MIDLQKLREEVRAKFPRRESKVVTNAKPANLQEIINAKRQMAAKNP